MKNDKSHNKWEIINTKTMWILTKMNLFFHNYQKLWNQLYDKCENVAWLLCYIKKLNYILKLNYIFYLDLPLFFNSDYTKT